MSGAESEPGAGTALAVPQLVVVVVKSRRD